jgi:hypothetical protein
MTKRTFWISLLVSLVVLWASGLFLLDCAFSESGVPTKAELQERLLQIKATLEQLDINEGLIEDKRVELTEEKLNIEGVLKYMELQAQAGREASQEEGETEE